MGVILQMGGIEALVALAAAVWAGVVVWKAVDYLITVRRDRAERERGPGPGGEP